jgi:hypothetical protein
MWTPGWAKVYEIQPMNAWANGEYEDIEDLIDDVLYELYDIDTPVLVAEEFTNLLASMIDAKDRIGILTLEIKNEEERGEDR